jgi:hypothetical protein
MRDCFVQMANVGSDSRVVGVHLPRLGAFAPGGIEMLRERFSENKYLRLHSLIGPPLLERILQETERSHFAPRAHGHIGSELCLPNDSIPSALLHFLVNESHFFKFVQSVTSCERIGCFAGRIYRMRPDSGHYDSWHDDLGNHRMIGLTINISQGGYEGGVLEMRDVLRNVEFAVPNTGLGDGILFQLSSHLKHRVTSVIGHNAKTAFAGWFCSEPNFLEQLKRRSATVQES